MYAAGMVQPVRLRGMLNKLPLVTASLSPCLDLGETIRVAKAKIYAVPECLRTLPDVQFACVHVSANQVNPNRR
jgi:hypothetical protein